MNNSTLAHLNGINSLEFSEDLLVSGGKDGILNNWKISLSNNPSNSPLDLYEQDNLQLLNSIHSHNKQFIPTISHNHITSKHIHSNWINQIIALNSNCIISCSSDRCVKLSTHSTTVNLGHHSDYVKTISYQDLNHSVISGGLDKKIMFFDLNCPGKQSRNTIHAQDSIYSISSAKHCNIFVTGSRRKFINLYDYKSNENPILKLSGHTQGIRSLRISDDGKFLLSGSSDGSVKYWSLAMPRTCIYSYTHFESSIWNITTLDSNLDTFWVGTRSGWIWKINQNNGIMGDCVAICKQDNPITSIASYQNSIWVSTLNSNINCWIDAPNDSMDNYDSSRNSIIIPPKSHFRHPNDISEYFKGVDSNYRFYKYLDEDFTISDNVLAMWKVPCYSIIGSSPYVKAELLNNKRHALVQCENGDIFLWDIIKCICLKSFTEPDFQSLYNSLNTKEWVSTWCTLDISTGELKVILEEGICYNSEIYADELGLDIPNPEDHRSKFSTFNELVNLGLWALKFLFLGYLKHSQKLIPISEVDLSKQRMSILVDDSFQSPSSDTPILPIHASFEDVNSSPKFTDLVPKQQISTTYLPEEFKFLNLNETPWIEPPVSAFINISVFESSEVGSALDLFSCKSGDLISSKEECDRLSEVIPTWLYECILEGKLPEREVVKISFILDPHPESKLKHLPEKNNRLTSNRMLRVKKIITYVQTKLETDIKLDIYLNNNVIDEGLSISTLKHFYSENKKELLLQYKESV